MRAWPDNCDYAGRRLPVGVVFADGCNSCECFPNGVESTVGCDTKNIGCNPPCPWCVFDPGCDRPRAFGRFAAKTCMAADVGLLTPSILGTGFHAAPP
jgi:hypothetical protein